MVSSVAGVLLGAAVFGFGRPSDIEAQATRDSAGIRIVENTRPTLPAARAWRVDATPALEIGGLSSDSLYEFLRVMGVVKLSDGRIAVANQGSSTIRFFDAQGKFVGSTGRNGRGPGEFQQILGMARVASDTLVVTDLDEVEYFTGAGKFVRQGAAEGRESGRFIWPGAILRDGSYVGLDLNEPTVPPAGRRLDSLPLLHVSADGQRRDTLGAFPARAAIFDGRSPYGQPVVYAPIPTLAAFGDGFLFGYGDRYELRAYSISGGLRAAIRRRQAPIPVTDDDRESYRTWFRSMPGEDGRPAPPAMRARLEARARSMQFMHALPAFASILADARGNAWVEHYDVALLTSVKMGQPASVTTLAVPTHWDVFDPAGRWLCTVTLPANFTPLDIGGDFVAGLARDGDDVEYVRLYHLVKP